MKKNKTTYTIYIVIIFTIIINACQTKTFSIGQESYNNKCANCHGQNGEGLNGLIPPLANSDYLKKNKDQIACIIKNGLNGEIQVNGIKYEQAMPAASNRLTAADIANIINFIQNEWGNNNGEISLPEVQSQLDGCKQDHFE
jgi:mono/diheme cytochrome c family protein